MRIIGMKRVLPSIGHRYQCRYLPSCLNTVMSKFQDIENRLKKIISLFIAVSKTINFSQVILWFSTWIVRFYLIEASKDLNRACKSKLNKKWNLKINFCISLFEYRMDNTFFIKKIIHFLLFFNISISSP